MRLAKNKLLLFAVIIILNLNAYGQKRLEKLQNNSNFEWEVVNVEKGLTLYYEENSYAEKNIDELKVRVKQHLKSTMDFIGVEAYEKPIHYFILEDRERMKLLVGYATNGNANPKNNFITAIFSANLRSVYSNHELFHLLAMNLWGYPNTWINEGMAVYSDNIWNGKDLNELSKYFIENDKYIPIERIVKKLKKYDSGITYPLLGSFIKFIDETYGRETIKLIWSKGRRALKKELGKSLAEIEKEWLLSLNSVAYENVK